MSFEPTTDLDEYQSQDHHRLLPQVPPPAAPPPPPPPESANNSRSGSPTVYYSTFTTSQTPTIIQYHEVSPASLQRKQTVPVEWFLPSTEDPQQPQQRQQQQQRTTTTTSRISSFFGSSAIGDASIRPNIGESNAAIGEASLRESLSYGRWINLVACLVALSLEIPHFLGHVLFLHPARTVLGVYLSIFSIVLLTYESGFEQGRDFLRHQFGFIHHPLGRSFLLLQMSGLAIGQGGILEILLGLVFLGSSIHTSVTFCWYPEYRRRIGQEGGDEERNSILVVARDHFWANPIDEASSLLHKAIRTTPSTKTTTSTTTTLDV